MPFNPILLVAAGIVVLAGCWGWYLVRGSTATPAAAWAVAAAAACLLEAAASGSGWLTDPATRGCVRLVVAALAVCPIMSLLGAKRPQHGIWQFIVGTLAVVLALPAASALLVRPGSMPEVHPLERGFFVVLLAVGWMNFVGTRHGPAATLATVGLVGLLRGGLPGGDLGRGLGSMLDAGAAACVAAGAVLAAGQSAWQASRAAERDNPVLRIEGPYLALRETLGAAWTLRIAERFNAVAAERRWPCRLRFGGLVTEQADGPSGWERDATRCIRALLRRFVSDAWLARHGESPIHDATPYSTSSGH